MKIDAQHIQLHVIFMVINISCIQHWINIESKPLFVPIFMIWSVPNRIFVLRCRASHTAYGWPNRISIPFFSINVWVQTKHIWIDTLKRKQISRCLSLSFFISCVKYDYMVFQNGTVWGMCNGTRWCHDCCFSDVHVERKKQQR